ncbi:Flavin Reduct [Geosmithia morbida]|uniref:Flavin Reduct n=1 Tax=Geosmithia morbida TaxID=1094350 RepID=A0A9P4YQP8_9HYPO|nr:Flavin Reduct [Geosmithia morbida]KAF4119279.1 Flavin Reduct [Geosmithia morbida]
MADKMQRNPHPDFKKVESSRPDFDTTSSPSYTKTPSPSWKMGQGANSLDPPSSASASHTSIDPYDRGRPAAFNYKLLISSIVPRPIAFVSTCAADGSSANLAPFSYFNMLNHDPPLFVVGLSAAAAGSAKDTLRNLTDAGECVVNIISEAYVEAANAAAVNAPYGVDEWAVSGLHPASDCETVRPARVREAVFSIEAKVDTIKHYDSRANPGRRSGTVVILEGLRFWVRDDAVNEEKSLVDINVLRPVGRLGGITYTRANNLFELPRFDWENDLGGEEGYKKIQEAYGKGADSTK